MEQREVLAKPHRGGRTVLKRSLGFVALAVVAQLSAALPPGGPNDPMLYWASTAVLVACVGSMALPWQRFPQWAHLLMPLVYLASVCLLLLSGGVNPSVPSTAGGLTVLVLLPVLAMALYYPRWYSVVVIVAAMISLTLFGILSQQTMATDVRRLLLWTVVSAAIAVSIQSLRRRLEGRAADSDELVRLGRLMNSAMRSLTSMRDPQDVIAEGTQVMADLAGNECSRSVYLRVRDEVVMQVAVTDVRGGGLSSHLLRDNPYVREVVETKRPLVAEIDRTRTGPTLRSVIEEFEVTHAAWIPIAPNGQLHGIISVASRGTPVSDDAFARCRAVGNIVELALGNALAHEELEIQANTDPLTGLANRRGLSLFLQGDHPPGRTAVLVLDVDGMKVANDTYGHEVGDQILVAVARSASRVMRAGDLLARTGGDEFVAVVRDADELDARRVVDRIAESVGKVSVRGVVPQVSVGYASALDGDFERAKQRADEAMYRVKPVRSRGDHVHSPA